jgi:hypothetical protein
MDSGQKARKRDRLISLLKRKERTQQRSSTQTTSGDANTDRQRARAKYLDAAKLLEETMKAYEGQWGSFDFSDLKGEPEDFDDSLFKAKINTIMDVRKNQVSDQSAWAKCRHAVQCAFVAFSPFAKHFLTIVNEDQAVYAVHCISHCT